MRKYSKAYFKEKGEEGMRKRWQERYELLAKLKGLYGPNWKEHKFIGWRTHQLKELYEKLQEK